MNFKNPLWGVPHFHGSASEARLRSRPVANPEIYNTEGEVDRRKHEGLSWQSRCGSNRY
jgi:hypothetical protein